MAVTIKEIKNLTNSALVPDTDLGKFDNKTDFSPIISADGIATLNWKPSDNIQVTWSDGTTVKARAVNGSISQEGTKYTISGLTDVSKYSFGINGELEIGPTDNSEPAATVSVRIGNLPSAKNKKADWLIDFSDKEGGQHGSNIKLKSLVNWIQNKTGDSSTPTYPELGGGKKPAEMTIVFNEFYFNITQNTFDFDVTTKQGEEITFGNFTIKNAGFRVTNNPIAFETKALDK
ncbi:hypothetical protein [Flavobacterium poyangense]|uniref:hypothetical protein n=1 Tax=Flavobacterium poyangense TaxID=2204302 RepID=UPI00141EB20A|nr:hypothetical protein [Flavobacterium sp. JXAS1]